ncbi:MAG TPA: tetratricopeptide repeat protein [Bacteroidetes bacterium]|nr:tetratricopeptide repeat protein [Bacteroidota bacterium]
MADVSDRWTRVQTLFEHALDRPEDERSAWLRAECGGDPDLYREVEALLEGDRERHPMFAGHAADLLSGDELADLLPTREGERVGAWTLGETLGEGGMGTVYRAERADADGPEGFRQSAALKLVKPGMDSAAVLARFHAERRILARLQHPGIARLLDGGLTDAGHPFFAMELVEGEPITDACDARALSIDARLALFARACEAVRYAHQQLVVHRDLKPSNLLVVETPEGLRPVLLDFGIARLLEDDDAGDLTRTGHRVLTPAYAAPEQVRGEPPTTATDVYALGGLLYRLLCGASPIPTASRARHEAEQAILSETPPRPSTRATAEAARQRGTTEAALARRLRGDLDTICLKALRKEPSERYGSAAELLADVQRFRDGLPVEARPASRGYRVRKFVARHRAGVLGTAAALLALVALSGFYTVRLAGERDRAEAEAEKAAEVSAFLETLFTASDPAVSGGDEVTARELLEAGASRVEAELAGQPEVQAQMYGTIGRVYRSLGLMDEASAALGRALALSTEPLAVARAQAGLALLRVEQADYASADSLLTLALATQRRLGGPDDDLVGTLQTRATLIQQGGAEGDPEPLLAEALALQRALHRGDHERTADLLVSLGRTHGNNGSVEAADSAFAEALDMRRRLVGAVHPRVSEALREIAQVRDVQRRDAEGLALIREAIAIDSQLVGMEHPSMGENLYVKGTLLVELARFDDATDVFEQTLAIDRVTLGPDHPYVALTLTQLGDVRRRAGDAPGAIRYYRQALALQRRVLPEDHPSVGLTLTQLGTALADAGDFGEAETTLREALRVRRLSNDENGPVVLSTRSELAAVLSRAGRHREAIAITRDALERRVRARGNESAAAASGLRDLAAALRQQGTDASLREAREVSARALRVYRATHEPGSREMAQALRERADVLWASGREEEARPVYREALETVRRALGADHPAAQSIEQRLAGR